MFFVRILICCGAVALCCLGGAGCGRDSTAVLMERALQESAAGDWVEVLKLAGQVTDRDPGDAAAWGLKTLAAERLGQHAVALESARRGAEVCPDSFLAQYSYGRLLAARPGRERDAIDYLLRAFTLNGKSFDCLSLAVQCAARINMEQTVNYYTNLLTFAPQIAASAEIQSSMGIYYLRNGNAREGLSMLIKAFNAAQDNPVATLNLARALDCYVGKSANSTRFYQRYLELTAQNPEASGVRTEVEARVRELTRGNR